MNNTDNTLKYILHCDCFGDLSGAVVLGYLSQHAHSTNNVLYLGEIVEGKFGYWKLKVLELV